MTGSRPPERRTVVVCYEHPQALTRRLQPLGLSDTAVSEIGEIYLAQAREVADISDLLADRFAARGLTLTFCELGDLEAQLNGLRGVRQPPIVWPLTDGFRFYSGSFAAPLAVLRGLPLFGSPPQAQMLCQDKFKCLALARAAGVATPDSWLARAGEIVAGPPEGPSGRLFVKPNTLGGKVGIWRDSLCEGPNAALALAVRIADAYGDDALIQPYVEGVDIRLSLLDVDGRGAVPGRFGVWRMQKRPAESGAGDAEPGAGDDQLAFVTMAEHDKYARTYHDLRREAEASDAAALGLAAILEAAVRVVRMFDLRGYFAMDFRLAADGTARFLEFETCPTVTGQDFRTYVGETLGLPHDDALARAVGAAAGS